MMWEKKCNAKCAAWRREEEDKSYSKEKIIDTSGDLKKERGKTERKKLRDRDRDWGKE